MTTGTSHGVTQARTRAHVGIAVADLAASIAFYRHLFQAEPTRVEARYARFEPHDPALLLALNEVASPEVPDDGVAHFGIQVASAAAVATEAARLERAGLKVDVERGVDCCYAVQDKAWVRDPDGRRWEIFTVLGEGQHHAPRDAGSQAQAACACAETPAARSCC